MCTRTKNKDKKICKKIFEKRWIKTKRKRNLRIEWIEQVAEIEKKKEKTVQKMTILARNKMKEMDKRELDAPSLKPEEKEK